MGCIVQSISRAELCTHETNPILHHRLGHHQEGRIPHPHRRKPTKPLVWAAFVGRDGAATKFPQPRDAAFGLAAVAYSEVDKNTP